ncbi:hypothetical protein [Saccharopolyspora cebuensis]|uniref:hypothetical protein n=1 Tax=Saccharopolyspora cebuensis TaxID=418759 RepID=UPI0031EBD010
MNCAGWIAFGATAVAAVASVWAARYFAPGRHGSAGAGATSAWQVIDECRRAPAPARTRTPARTRVPAHPRTPAPARPRVSAAPCAGEGLPPVPTPAPRPPRWLTLRGDLADALADEPTRLLPRIPAPRVELPPGYTRDTATLNRILDALHRL